MISCYRKKSVGKVKKIEKSALHKGKTGVGWKRID
jgi:hypothetical protein